MKKILLLLMMYVFNIKGQNEQPPKLVVGIVIDQMRYDYLIKFQKNFSKGGFIKLMNEGAFFKNVHYNYIPTYTAPGHASIYTGSTPRYHGIIANDWFDKKTGKEMYCVKDTFVQSVGTKNKSGKMSPKNLLANTITDELKLMYKNQCKVISISIKDRSAILPGGHMADAAYWWDDKSGDFISSTFYMKQLPDWLIKFNQLKYPESYLSQPWQLLLSKDKYLSTLPDSNQYEESIIKNTPPKFSYNFKNQIDEKKYAVLTGTPYGNSILIDLAKECVLNEKLGKHENTDFLCVSFSSTDYIGHYYGTESLELEDAYYRLNIDIANLITFLDKNIGHDNYTLFITADHAAAYNTNYMKDNKFNVSYFSEQKLFRDVKIFCQNKFGDSTIIANVSNGQIFFNAMQISKKNISKSNLETDIKSFCLMYPTITEAYTSSELSVDYSDNFTPYGMACKGYSPNKSGDIVFILQPQCMDYEEKGTTHGTAYNYDTHVPLILYGKGIKQMYSIKFYKITQLAPTLSYLLNINIPNTCFDKPIEELFSKENTTNQSENKGYYFNDK